jgi:hypothetical protein
MSFGSTKRMIVLNRLDSFDLGSFAPALRDVLLKEEISETLADVLFQVRKYAKGDGGGVISIPETEGTRVRAEIRREILLLDEDSPLAEMYEHLYKKFGEAAPR